MNINIVGSGPNGLVAGIRLAQAGAAVTIYETGDTHGGALRSGAPFAGHPAVVDYGATAHPTGLISPAFNKLGLHNYGLEWVHAEYPMAHPLENQDAVILHKDVAQTLKEFPAADRPRWEWLHRQVTNAPEKTAQNFLGPLLRWPNDLAHLTQFGLKSLAPVSLLGKTLFTSERARALFAGSAAHSVLPSDHPLTSAFGILFGGLGMSGGWPFARGGSQAIADALLEVFVDAGGKLILQRHVSDLTELPAADATVLNLTPRQVLALKNANLPMWKRELLPRWRYGSGVSKVDFLLDRPVPWSDPRVQGAGTVHVAGTLAEVNNAEWEASRRNTPNKPFVMVSQPEAADPTRNPDPSTKLLWTYAHVPHNYSGSVVELIVSQIERFAPGFRSTIVEYGQMKPEQLELWNPNLVGGDIGGGSLAGTQQIFRPLPTWNPYRLNRRNLYMASASTPPGGGAHGMAGWHCAATILKDFGVTENPR